MRFFILFYFILFFVFHKTTTGLPGGTGVCLLTPNSVKDMCPYQHGVGGVTDDGVGASWNLGGWSENNRSLGL